MFPSLTAPNRSSLGSSNAAIQQHYNFYLHERRSAGTLTYVLSVSMSSVMTFRSFSVSVSVLFGVSCCEGADPSLSTGLLNISTR